MLNKNFIRQKIIIAICILSACKGFAQEVVDNKESEEQIIADRPGQSDGPHVDPKGSFQIETGIQNEIKKEKTEDQKRQNGTYSTILWKYSVSDLIQLRLITSYGNDKINRTNTDSSFNSTIEYSGFCPITIGAKMALQEEEGILPEIGILGLLKLPYFGTNNYKPDYIIPQFKLLFANTLNKRFSISYNLGADLDDQLLEVRGSYSASLGMHISDNISAFVELYGFLGRFSKTDHRIDGGFMYVIKKNIQVDCSGGVGLNKELPSYFISAGLSVMFKTKNKKK
jgi:hypothetical protein